MDAHKESMRRCMKLSNRSPLSLMFVCNNTLTFTYNFLFYSPKLGARNSDFAVSILWSHELVITDHWFQTYLALLIAATVPKYYKGSCQTLCNVRKHCLLLRLWG